MLLVKSVFKKCHLFTYFFALGLFFIYMYSLKPDMACVAEEASHQCEFQEEMTTQVILIGNMFGIVVHAWYEHVQH